MLLLDEPTAELDRESEMRLLQVLKALAVDHTVVVVSHSPLLLSHCQGLMVMDKGKLLAAGPAANLLPKLGIQPAAAANSAPAAPAKAPLALQEAQA